MMDTAHMDASSPGNKHADVAWAVREAMHRILYTVVQSNAMNGISVHTVVEKVTPWWQTAVLCAQIAFGAAAAGCVAWVVIKSRKKESGTAN